MDSKGRLYVLDAGYTRVRSGSSSTEFVVPSRLMVWVRNPLTSKVCPEGATAEQCSYDSEGECVGEACVVRQCLAEECNASIIHGQPSPIQAYGIPSSTSGTLGETAETTPEGYLPMAAFAVASGASGGADGVYVATGRDNTVLHLKTPLNQSNPGAARMNLRTGAQGEDLRTKNGAFAGVMLDEIAGTLTLWDTRWNIGVAWSAKPTGGTTGGP